MSRVGLDESEESIKKEKKFLVKVNIEKPPFANLDR
jgi:hypothetical protein